MKKFLNKTGFATSQERVYVEIVKFVKSKKYFPTTHEICELTGLKYPNVMRIMKNLLLKDYLYKVNNFTYRLREK